MLIIGGIFIFWVGMIAGFLLLRWKLYRERDYSGVIHVSHDELTEKTVYSLELDEYPEKLEFKKVVVFKVDRD